MEKNGDYWKKKKPTAASMTKNTTLNTKLPQDGLATQEATERSQTQRQGARSTKKADKKHVK